MVATREFCQMCNRLSPIGFWVPKDVWEEVVHPHWQNSILCVQCFIARADEKLIAWDKEIKLYPTSFATHLANTRNQIND